MHSAKIRCVGLGNVFIGHFVTPPPMEKTKLRVAVLPMNFTSIIGPNVLSETGFHWIPKSKYLIGRGRSPALRLTAEAGGCGGKFWRNPHSTA